MHMQNLREQINIFDEIIVDNFAGGGGASTGIELATGRPVAIAINHDPAAILMHQANHPYTEHLQASVWDVDPREVCAGRPVGLAWFSPDCKHFSKAKGAALVDRNIRGLAWIVLRWAGTVRPRVIILENVEEFVTWGPVRKGKPVKSKKGQTFRKWLSQLEALGYTVEYRELVAADFGAPTTRKRFVLIARCDGKPIVWPEPTHNKYGTEGKKKWISAAEIIDWTQPMYSIFESKAEIKAKYGANAKPKRPLADNTLRRIIRGVDKFTIKSGEPFIVDKERPITLMGDYERGGEILHNPKIGRNSTGQPIIAPICFSNTGSSVGGPADQPVHTIRTGGGGGQLLAAANLVECNHSGDGHIGNVAEPIKTVTQKCTMGLTVANLIQYHTEQTEAARVNSLRDPLPTVDASNRYALTAAHLTEYYGNGQPLTLREPMHTVTGHDREALTAVHIAKYYGGVVGAPASEPLPTVTAIDHNALTASHIVEFKGQDIGQAVTRPLRTITASSGEFGVAGVTVVKYRPGADLGYWPQVRALLNKYCGYHLADDELLLISIHGVLYYISDITLRMLTPRELYRAMGFPEDYIIEMVNPITGKPYTRSEQVARCGNAVCPPMARAVVAANLPEWCIIDISTMAQLLDIIAV